MTKARLSGLLLAIYLLFCAGLSLRASEAPSHAYAILIGIGKYTGDEQINTRPHAEDDIKALYDLLSDKAYLGIEPAHMHLLLGTVDPARKSESATRRNIIQAMHSVASSAGRDDLVIFAFVGQGAPLGDEHLCYLAVDSTLKDRAKNAVAAADIQQEFDKLASQRFCALIDVNFKGYSGGPVKIPEASLGKDPYREFRGADGKEDQAPAPGRALFLATLGLSSLPDSDKHGLFTQVVLNGLKGAADKQGYEPDGLVTVDELQEYVNKELPDRIRKTGKTDSLIVSHVESHSSHFPITRNPAVTTKVKARLDQFTQMSGRGNMPEEWVTEGQQLLNRMPKLKFQQELRRAYQQFVDGSLDADGFARKRDEIIASTRLRKQDAASYAKKIVHATEILRDGYVKEIHQGDLVAWGIKGLFRQIDEPLPSDFRERLDKARQLSESDLYDLLVEVRQKLGKRDDLDNHKDIDYSLQRMLANLDPYTTYIDPDMVARFTTETTGKFRGIGISIREEKEQGGLLVVTPIKGSPAYRAGLRAGDLITEIVQEVDQEGNPLPEPVRISTKDMTTNDAVKKIQGKPGTKVKVILKREGEAKPLEFEITRDTIEVESVLGFKRTTNDDWDYMIDPEHKIAYVRLTSFARLTSRDLLAAVKKLTKQGINGLVLDLRFNPGGLLNSAVEICDMFIKDGLIVTIRPRPGTGPETPYSKDGRNSDRDTTFVDFPMVVLVNGTSASGSEIVAACLQDQHRAVIMGERSYGKGSVQNIQPFDNGELKLTTASFWRPNGENLNKSSTKGADDEKWGVSPNKGYALKLTVAETRDVLDHQRKAEIIVNPYAKPEPHKNDFKDTQLEMALNYLRGQIRTAATTPLKRAG
jgi:C-terminal peptidase prc